MRATAILLKAGDGLSPREAVLAATAQGENAVLVHRNPRLSRLPGNLLQQSVLPLEN